MKRRTKRTPVRASCSVELIPEGKRITLVLPWPTPSLNDFSYSHWRVEQNEKKRWRMMLLGAFGARKLDLLALGKRKLTIERRSTGKGLDFDNLVGGAKRVLTDNLRHFELLTDDDSAGVEFVARNAKPAPGVAAHTVVTIEDI